MKRPRKTFHSPEGITTRELTDEEIADFAERGDRDCLQYLFAEEYAKPGQLQEKVDLIAQYLGLAEKP